MDLNGTSRIALTVDLEDEHHGLGVDRGSSTFESDVSYILDLFCALGVKATFFVLGEIVKTHPAVVKKVAAGGHEVAFHGATHHFLADVGPANFEKSIVRCVPSLEDLTGCAVRGFRAPYFSLARDTQWCLAVLARHGFRYDASLYSGPNDRYGWLKAPTTPVEHAPTGMLIFPVPLLHPMLPIAFSGGAYLRIMPWTIVMWGIRRHHALRLPGMIYFHPWEISSRLPWRRDAPLRANLTRHLFRKRMRARLQRLLPALAPRLGRMADILLTLDHLPQWDPDEACSALGSAVGRHHQ